MSTVVPFTWPGWRNLIDSYKFAPQAGGAYIIALCKPIHRLNEIDPDGILDVGESNCLRTRLTAFVGCARKTRKSSHMAGWRFGYYDFASQWPLEGLWVTWLKASAEQSSYALENQILRLYFVKHFELPPLNYKFNWEHEKKHGA
ncbi:hypothetical protein [Geothrix mesophila]|uniref:hypothetical protein n=1 Tax=Geothrix mesophila TaxID=2922723 RepID=UPI001FAC2677|nr:hypothetical protein [Geothrix sp. SG198]